MLRSDGRALVKARLTSVKVSRWSATTTGGSAMESHSSKTWALATVRLLHWAKATETRQNFSNTLLVQARWKNGLQTHAIGFDFEGALTVTDLGATVREFLHDAYGTTKKLRSAKATLARECLSRCSFTDTEESSEDARTFDAAKRALETCFPEHAANYIDRIRGWMLDGGRVR